MQISTNPPLTLIKYKITMKITNNLSEVTLKTQIQIRKII